MLTTLATDHLHALHAHSCCHACAGTEGGGEKHQSLITIGDKGRSQLSRFEPEKLMLTFADTYKTRVTFPQVQKETGIGSASGRV